MTTPEHQLGIPSILLTCATLLLQATTVNANAETNFRLPRAADEIMEAYCYTCHDEDAEKGDVRLDNLADLDEVKRLDLLNRVQEQVFFKHMPPEKKKQPSPEETQALVQWLSVELNKHAASTLDGKMQQPDYGNYVDHRRLFSGKYKDLKGFTYDRDWIISEYIFSEKMDALLNLKGYATVDGSKRKLRGNPLPIEITNPFLLPETSGVRYYANEKINSSHFLTMIGNAQYASSAMIDHLSITEKNYLPSVAVLLAVKEKHDSILESRELYLDWHIDRLCKEIYGDEHEQYLPAYTELPLLEEEINQERKGFGKNGWVGRIGTLDGQIIKAGTMRFGKAGDDKAAIIRMCERYWFHAGMDAETVSRCMSILARELATILTYDNLTTLPKQESLSSGEIQIISSTIKQIRKKGMSYQSLKQACMAHWRMGFQKLREATNSLNDTTVETIIGELYEKIFERSPSKDEVDFNSALLRSYAEKMGNRGAVGKLTQTLLLDSEFIVRNEYGVGLEDQHGRRMLSARYASYAIAYALTDSSPDAQLRKAVEEGRLSTREDYKREVQRLLADRSHFYVIDTIVNAGDGVDCITNLPIRNVRFFREFFGYYDSLKVFKDEVRLGFRLSGVRERLVSEADMFVANVLENDISVFDKLLTSDEFYVFHSGDNQKIVAATNQIKRAFDYFQSQNWRDFKNSKDLMAHKAFLVEEGVPGLPVSKNDNAKKGHEAIFKQFINIMANLESRFVGKKTFIPPFSGVRFVNYGVHKRITSRNNAYLGASAAARFYNINPGQWDYPAVQPAKVDNRKGILTHPAWLQTFSQNTHTDPVTRGKWIREKLLAGTIPDVPIGVEAVIPEDHAKTLRQRLDSVTTASECWRCHKYMNPLGTPFESYDDFGRFRLKEELEHPENIIGEVKREGQVKTHPLQTFPGRSGKQLPPRATYKTAPLNTAGVLDGTGDDLLDGEVKDANDLIARLAKSERVRQSIIRHAFRYFMGRNEVLSDSKTLIDADQAYLSSNGSFDAVVISLLTSDSFIYRKQIKE